MFVLFALIGKQRFAPILHVFCLFVRVVRWKTLEYDWREWIVDNMKEYARDRSRISVTNVS